MHFIGPREGERLWGGAENQYLSVAAELGLFALVLFLWLLLRVHRELVRAYREDPEGFTGGVSLALIGGLWVMAVVGMFAEIFAQWRVMGPFWFLTGVVLGVRRSEAGGRVGR